MNRDILKIRFS